MSCARKSARGRPKSARVCAEESLTETGTRGRCSRVAFPVPKWHVAAWERDANAKFGRSAASRVPRGLRQIRWCMIFFGKPVSTPDQLRGGLFPDHAPQRDFPNSLSPRRSLRLSSSDSPTALERDELWFDRHPAPAFCLSMIFSENWLPPRIESGAGFFRIMLSRRRFRAPQWRISASGPR